ncbi:MAG: EamA family transporter [Simkaniaceae bacterium]
MKPQKEIKNLILLFSIALCWGPSYYFIMIALESFPPLTIVAFRVLLGAIVLFLVVLSRGRRLLDYKHAFPHFLIMALTACVIPFTLVTLSETMISSSLAAIVNASVPIFVAFMAHFLIDQERMSLMKWIGIFCGLLGIGLVYAPSLIGDMDTKSTGILLVIIASLSYGLGMIYGKVFLYDIPGLVAPTWQLIFSSLIILPFSLIIDKPWQLGMPSWLSLFGLISLSLIGTALAFYLYYTLLNSAGATYLSLVSFLFPIVGINLGVILLKEKITWSSFAGCGLILLGLLITTYKTSKQKELS